MSLYELNYRMVKLIETPFFTRAVKKLLTQTEYQFLIELLLDNPKIGIVELGTLGARKIRLPRIGHGKSAGFRVIYFYYLTEEEIWLIDIYGKNDKSTADKKSLRKIISEIKK